MRLVWRMTVSHEFPAPTIVDRTSIDTGGVRWLFQRDPPWEMLGGPAQNAWTARDPPVQLGTSFSGKTSSELAIVNPIVPGLRAVRCAGHAGGHPAGQSSRRL